MNIKALSKAIYQDKTERYPVVSESEIQPGQIRIMPDALMRPTYVLILRE